MIKHVAEHVVKQQAKHVVCRLTASLAHLAMSAGPVTKTSRRLKFLVEASFPIMFTTTLEYFMDFLKIQNLMDHRRS